MSWQPLGTTDDGPEKTTVLSPSNSLASPNGSYADLKKLRRPSTDLESVLSPMRPSSALLVEETKAYCEFCRALQIAPHPGVLVFLRLRLAQLKPIPERLWDPGAKSWLQRTETVSFADPDLYAFCDFVLSGPALVFDHWREIDLQHCAISSTGCQA
jgi:hypothetical protein